MNRKGFTLIELLVVVAIIGVLASIVLAALGSAKQAARETEVVSEVNSIKKALELYYLENGNYPIIPTNDDNWTRICDWGEHDGHADLANEIENFIDINETSSDMCFWYTAHYSSAYNSICAGGSFSTGQGYAIIYNTKKKKFQPYYYGTYNYDTYSGHYHCTTWVR